MFIWQINDRFWQDRIQKGCAARYLNKIKRRGETSSLASPMSMLIMSKFIGCFPLNNEAYPHTFHGPTLTF